ncbi:MAG: ATP-binding protein, partial [Gaiellaceae bacterium]
CPQCGGDNPPHARFCLACGSRLEAAAAPAEERKVVTVLFADVVGFTGLAERLDPEDVRSLLTPFYALMRSVLSRYGGAIEQFMGDGVMAVFGAPVAHEDDPERAVRAALSIRESVVARNEGDADFQLDIRIGVNTGEVLLSHDQGGRLVAGDAVNTAQRLQTAAPVNGILVGEETFRATQRHVEYREVGAVEAKGKTEPVFAWEALAPFARYGPEVLRESPGKLVGRRVEVALLEGMLLRAMDARESQLVTVVGVPGIGKSRLLAEIFLRGMSERPGLVYWRQGRCPPYGERVAFSALGDMVRAQAGILDTDSAEEAGAKLHAALERLGDDTEWMERHLGPLAGLAEERAVERQGEAFAAWRRFFECLARDRPTILVFEDLQWADDGLLDFVDQLVDRLRELPLLVVCTARLELLDRRPDWGGGKRNSTTITLPRLTDAETRTLVEGLLEGVPVTDAQVAALAARAEGNPLYAEEFVQMLRERGLLDPAAEGEAPLPVTVQGIVASRIDALPPAEKALLVDASVIGKLFWERALDALADAPDPGRRELLRSLERRELIRRERSSTVAGEEEYAFRHVLMREVAYRLLPRSRRAEKHLRAAEWIERLAAARADHAEQRADHYLAALGYTRDGSAAVAERARLALRDAGARALALASPERAVEYYEQALALWPQDDPERARLVLAYGQARHRHDQSGAEAFVEAREALLAQGDREHAAEADVALAYAHFSNGRRDEAVECLERSAALLRDAPPSRAKVWVLSSLASFLLLGDRATAAQAVGEQALAMAEELDDDELRSRSLRIVGAARSAHGDATGLQQLERSIELALRLNSFEAVPSLTNLAAMYISFGDLQRAFDLQAQALELADRFADAMTTFWLTAERVPELYWRGEWDAALALAAQLLEERNASYITGILHVTQARIALARGDAQTALAASERGMREARSAHQDSQYVLPTLAIRARVLQETGAEDAPALADELLGTLTGEEIEAGSHWADLAAVLVPTGRQAELLEAAGRVKTPTRWVDAAEALGRGDFALAADTFAEIGSRPDEAWARLQAARATRDAEQRRRALEFFRSVGAAAYASAADDVDAVFA